MKNNIENNKLIAEFMGVKPHERPSGHIRDYNSYWYDGHELHEVGLPFSSYGVMGNDTSDLKFNSSWDWLMPVVEKIQELGFEVQIGRISCKVFRILEEDKPIFSLVCGDLSKKIVLVYDIVVQFIKWYNNESKI